MESNKNNDRNEKRTTKEINNAIRDLLGRSNRVRISGLSDHHSIAIGLSGEMEVDITGNAGDYLGSLNNGPVIILRGDAKHRTGDMLQTGGIIVLGKAGNLTGVNMQGGIIVIKGDCGSLVGSNMVAGTIIVDGSVHGDAAPDMRSGVLIVTGDILGTVGKGMVRGKVIFGGNVKNKASFTEERILSKEEKGMLLKYFDHYAIEAQPVSFRKIVPKGGTINGR